MPKKPQSSPRKKRYRLLTDESLTKLSENGDPQAKLALEFKQNLVKLINSQEKGSMFWKPYYRLDNWLIMEFRKDNLGYVEMVLRIGKGTKRETITSHWKEIKYWQNFLTKRQTTHPFDDHLLDFLEIVNRNGFRNIPHSRWSYKKIAEYLNRQFHDALYYHVHPQADTESKPDARLKEARELLQEFRLRDEEIERFCSDTIEDLRQGRSPYWAQGPKPLEEPITRDHVIARLRSHRASRKRLR